MALVGLGLGLEQRGGVMGHTIESKFRAQVGLGTLMPYISPTLICTWYPRTNQGR